MSITDPTTDLMPDEIANLELYEIVKRYAQVQDLLDDLGVPRQAVADISLEPPRWLSAKERVELLAGRAEKLAGTVERLAEEVDAERGRDG